MKKEKKEKEDKGAGEAATAAAAAAPEIVTTTETAEETEVEAADHGAAADDSGHYEANGDGEDWSQEASANISPEMHEAIKQAAVEAVQQGVDHQELTVHVDGSLGVYWDEPQHNDWPDDQHPPAIGPWVEPVASVAWADVRDDNPASDPGRSLAAFDAGHQSHSSDDVVASLAPQEASAEDEGSEAGLCGLAPASSHPSSNSGDADEDSSGTGLDDGDESDAP